MDFLEKYGLKEGGKVTLEKKYEDDSYTFTVSGTYDYPATLSVFMSMENFNRIFDYDEDYFNGYFTDKKIKDIDSSMVASIITQDDLTVIADQLEDSMGDMMWLMCAFSVFLYVLVIYLLAKMIVEKNEQSISMIKILGYKDKKGQAPPPTGAKGVICCDRYSSHSNLPLYDAHHLLCDDAAI